MSEEYHHVHHEGSPRLDPPDSDPSWVIITTVVIAVFIISFWHVIVAVVLALTAIGGLGSYVWRIKKHALALNWSLVSLKRALASCQKRKREIDAIEVRRSALSDSDYRTARSHAVQRFNAAVEHLRTHHADVASAIRDLKDQTEAARQKILQRAHKIKETKLKKALGKLDEVTQRLSQLETRLDSEAGNWTPINETNSTGLNRPT